MSTKAKQGTPPTKIILTFEPEDFVKLSNAYNFFRIRYNDDHNATWLGVFSTKAKWMAAITLYGLEKHLERVANWEAQCKT